MEAYVLNNRISDLQKSIQADMDKLNNMMILRDQLTIEERKKSIGKCYLETTSYPYESDRLFRIVDINDQGRFVMSLLELRANGEFRTDNPRWDDDNLKHLQDKEITREAYDNKRAEFISRLTEIVNQ
jgi:hypothetical protein